MRSLSNQRIFASLGSHYLGGCVPNGGYPGRDPARRRHGRRAAPGRRPSVMRPFDPAILSAAGELRHHGWRFIESTPSAARQSDWPQNIPSVFRSTVDQPARDHLPKRRRPRSASRPGELNRGVEPPAVDAHASGCSVITLPRHGPHPPLQLGVTVHRLCKPTQISSFAG
jgi:hypothetical protein